MAVYWPRLPTDSVEELNFSMSSCPSEEIIYISEVVPEPLAAGQILIWRLLSASSKKISQLWTGRPQIPQDYSLKNQIRVCFGHSFLKHTRFHRFSNIIDFLIFSPIRAVCIAYHCISKHTQGSVLTVAHGNSWISAWLVSLMLRRPLVVLVHDWPTGLADLPKVLKLFYGYLLKLALSHARTCLAISEPMANHLQSEYSVSSLILRPSSGRDAILLSPKCEVSGTNSVRFSYSGSSHPMYDRMLMQIATTSTQVSLSIFSNITAEYATRSGLLLKNVDLRGFLSSTLLPQALASAGDFGLILASFDAENAEHMTTLFPSKIVSYLESGVPIVVWGPAYSAIVRFANDNPGCFVVIDSNDAKLVVEKVREISRRPDLYRQFSQRLRAQIAPEFSYDAVSRVFNQAFPS